MVIAIELFFSVSRTCVVIGGMTITRPCGRIIRRITWMRVRPLESPASICPTGNRINTGTHGFGHVRALMDRKADNGGVIGFKPEAEVEEE